MGQLLSQKCCTDRKDEGPHKGRKSVADSNAYDSSKKTKMSIGYRSEGDDAGKFDKAVEKNDLVALVDLLKSNQKIDSFEERMHPWAEDPKTVGALAATQLAILASSAESATIKDDIRKAGAIPPLIGFLQSDSQDRVQTAVVGLSFLSSESVENARELHKGGAMPLLLKCMESKVAGMRAAAATTLRNICVESEECKKQFVDMGGIKELVKQLDSQPDKSLNQADVQLEAILNLQDMIENTDGTLQIDSAKKALEAGAVEKLKKLCQVNDDEVKSSAEELLTSLSKVK